MRLGCPLGDYPRVTAQCLRTAVNTRPRLLPRKSFYNGIRDTVIPRYPGVFHGKAVSQDGVDVGMCDNQARVSLAIERILSKVSRMMRDAGFLTILRKVAVISALAGAAGSVTL